MLPKINIKRYVEFEIDASEITIANYSLFKTVIDAFTNEFTDYEFLIIDLKNVVYLDSSGTGLLISIVKRTHKILKLKNCSDQVKHLLDIMDLKDKFEFV